MNWHRHDYSERDADSKPVQTGTAVFIRELKSRHFPRADETVKHVRGQQLTIQYLQTNGFETPIIIDGKEGLDMTLPPPNFSVYDVESYIGKVFLEVGSNYNLDILYLFTSAYINDLFFSVYSQVVIETWT